MRGGPVAGPGRGGGGRRAPGGPGGRAGRRRGGGRAGGGGPGRGHVGRVLGRGRGGLVAPLRGLRHGQGRHGRRGRRRGLRGEGAGHARRGRVRPVAHGGEPRGRLRRAVLGRGPRRRCGRRPRLGALGRRRVRPRGRLRGVPPLGGRHARGGRGDGRALRARRGLGRPLGLPGRRAGLRLGGAGPVLVRLRRADLRGVRHGPAQAGRPPHPRPARQDSDQGLRARQARRGHRRVGAGRGRRSGGRGCRPNAHDRRDAGRGLREGGRLRRHRGPDGLARSLPAGRRGRASVGGGHGIRPLPAGPGRGVIRRRRRRFLRLPGLRRLGRGRCLNRQHHTKRRLVLGHGGAAGPEALGG